jgi:hypothetical protein
MIIRTYECSDCDQMFEVECAADDGDPPCPVCATVLEWRPQRVNIGGSSIGKAANVVQDIIENDYGMTNFKEAKHEGDTAAITPVETTSSREAAAQEAAEIARAMTGPALPPGMQQAVKGFWAGSAGGPPMGMQQMLQGTRTGPEAGVTGAGIVHGLSQMNREGKLGPICRPLAKSDLKV